MTGERSYTYESPRGGRNSGVTPRAFTPSNSRQWPSLRIGIVGCVMALALANHNIAAQAPDQPLLRLQYLEEQRSWPLGTIPPGALERARGQMRNRWPELFARDRIADFTTSTSFWSPIGPAPINTGDAGRVSAIAVDPRDSNTIYAGGAQGGVWKSVDGGQSWNPLTDTECSLAMGSIAIDPVNTQILYAGTGELHFSADSYYGCGVLRSTDGGASWTRLGAAAFAASTGGARISRLILDPSTAGSTSATTVFAASSNGVYVTRDSGITWTQSLAGVATDIAFDAGSPSILYAAIGLPGGGSANGVYKSTDGARTWSRLSGFPIDDVGRIALGASPSTPGTVYAAVQDAFGGGGDDGRLLGIWRTTDGGGTWTTLAASRADCGSQCWYNLVIATDPLDPQTVYFGGISLFKSVNGGDTFVSVLRNMHVDQHALTFDPADPTTLYAGNDGGVFRSRNGGASWEPLNAGLAITQFYAGVSLHPTDSTIVLGGTQDNGTLEFRGNTIWNAVLGADGGFTAIDHEDPEIAWAETQWTVGSGFSGPRVRLASGGFDQRRVNGIDTNDRALFIPPLVMDPTAAAVLYFGTYRIYRTSNRGVIWAPISDDLSNGGNGRISAIAPSASDPATIWVGTSDGNVQVTRNGGATWALRRNGLPTRFVTDIAVNAFDPDIAIASVSGFGTDHVFRTTDGGLNWNTISPALPNIPVTAVMTDAALGNSVYIGTDLGVFRSFDNGVNWEPFGDGLPNVAIFDLVYNRGTGIAVAGTHGRSVFAFRPVAASAIAILPDSVRFASLGDTIRLGAVALGTAGDTLPNATPVWRSLDEGIATVDRTGLVRATGNGVVDITAMFAGVADNIRVTVSQVAVDIIGLDPALALVVGETRQLTARAVDANGAIISNAMTVWTSSNPAVATVDTNGTVGAVGTGSVTVAAAFGGLSESIAVSVSPPATGVLTATAATAPANPLSSAGTILPLLTIRIVVEGNEALRITRLGFTVRGDDPAALFIVIRDDNGNGVPEPSERVDAGATLALRAGESAEVTLAPADLRIEGGATANFIVAIKLSGGSPNGAAFQATFLPAFTSTRGERSGLADRIVQPAAPVESATVNATLLAAGQILSFSENPVRSERVIFNFAEAPTRAAVYTVGGRLVIDLTRDIAGDDRLEWDLRNGDGDRIAPGVYLVIFDVGGVVMRERLMILRPDTDERAYDRMRDRLHALTSAIRSH